MRDRLVELGLGGGDVLDFLVRLGHEGGEERVQPVGLRTALPLRLLRLLLVRHVLTCGLCADAWRREKNCAQTKHEHTLPLAAGVQQRRTVSPPRRQCGAGMAAVFSLNRTPLRSVQRLEAQNHTAAEAARGGGAHRRRPAHQGPLRRIRALTPHPLPRPQEDADVAELLAFAEEDAARAARERSGHRAHDGSSADHRRSHHHQEQHGDDREEAGDTRRHHHHRNDWRTSKSGGEDERTARILAERQRVASATPPADPEKARAHERAAQEREVHRPPPALPAPLPILSLPSCIPACVVLCSPFLLVRTARHRNVSAKEHANANSGEKPPEHTTRIHADKADSLRRHLDAHRRAFRRHSHRHSRTSAPTI